jgi:hypothetical protein
VTCLVSMLTRIVSCVFLYAVVLYAPGFIPVFVLPKWVWHDRPDSGFARRRPADVICPRRLAEAEAITVGYSALRRKPDRTKPVACILASD